MITVCFRFDDPSPTGDHDLERMVIEVFARHAVPLGVAAVPFRKQRDGSIARMDANNASHLVGPAREGSIEIYQHGHFHENKSASGSGEFSEFRGVDREAQSIMIKDGLAQLRGVFEEVSGFVPPWNTYDSMTEKVAEDMGFRFLSTNIRNWIPGRFPVVPGTCTLRNIQDAVGNAMRFQGISPVVTSVLHPDDFCEFSAPPLPGEDVAFTDLSKLDELLLWLKSISIVRFQFISEVAGSIRIGVPLLCMQEFGFVKFLPWRIRAHAPGNILVRCSQWRAAKYLLGIVASHS